MYENMSSMGRQRANPKVKREKSMKKSNYAENMFSTLSGLVPVGCDKMPAAGSSKHKNLKKLIKYYKMASTTIYG